MRCHNLIIIKPEDCTADLSPLQAFILSTSLPFAVLKYFRATGTATVAG